MSTMRRAVWLLALFLLTSVSASAQQTTGTIVGRVLDDQGAAIPGATVIASSASTGFTREAISDAEGVYRLSALPVGRFGWPHRRHAAGRSILRSGRSNDQS